MYYGKQSRALYNWHSGNQLCLWTICMWKKIENYYDITTDSINGRLCSSFTAITNNDDDSEKIFALKDNVNFIFNKTKKL